MSRLAMAAVKSSEHEANFASPESTPDVQVGFRTEEDRRHSVSQLVEATQLRVEMQVLDDRVAELEEENAGLQQKLADMEAVAKAHAEESARAKMELQHEREEKQACLKWVEALSLASEQAYLSGRGAPEQRSACVQQPQEARTSDNGVIGWARWGVDKVSAIFKHHDELRMNVAEDVRDDERERGTLMQQQGQQKQSGQQNAQQHWDWS